jgi:curved DNA-binding protein CbpA
MEEEANCYQLLDCPSDATPEQVREKYKQLALKVCKM